MDKRRPDTSVAHVLLDRLQPTGQPPRWRQRDADGHWQSISAADIRALIHQLRTILKAQGLQPGDRVAIVAPGSWQWAAAEFAVMAAGLVVVGIEPHAPPQQMRDILAHCQPRAILVASPDTLPALRDDIAHAIPCRISFTPADGWIACQPTTHAHTIDAPCAGPDDPATLIYTSGTTGQPRAIAYTHAQLLHAADVIAETFDQLGSDDVTLCWLPMAHLFQRMVNLVALQRDATICFLDDPTQIMAAIREVEPTVFSAVPRFYEKLHEGMQQRLSRLPRPLRFIAYRTLHSATQRIATSQTGDPPHPPSVRRFPTKILGDRLVLARLRAVMGRRLRFMLTGTAPTPPHLLRFFHAVGLPIFEAYGLSENVVPMACNRPGCIRLGSVGKPLPGNDIRVADDGELLVRGKGVFNGYWNDPDMDRSRFDAEGYYRTGDLGRVDEEGFVYITGRKAELIKTSTGRRIAPVAIEAVLKQSPLIDQAVVVGDGRRVLVALIQTTHKVPAGEATGHLAVDAAAQRSQLQKAVADELLRLAAQLPPHERPAAFELLPRPLSISQGELTPTLKLRRRVIAEHFADLIEAMYTRLDAAGQSPTAPARVDASASPRSSTPKGAL